jgi:hypothetical protein
MAAAGGTLAGGMDGDEGSDSDRLMAQIEAFLRTGDAPPAAPEPVRSPARPRTRPLELQEFDATAGGSNGPERARVRDRLAGRLSAPVLRTWRRPPGGTRSRLRRYWDQPDRVGRPPNREDLPRWTPWRAVLVVGALAALLILPVVISNGASKSNPDGPDRASAAVAGPGYTFLRVNPSGTPVRWDPCRPIYYQLDLSGAPASAAGDVRVALAQISEVTGLSFVAGRPAGPPPAGTDQQPPLEITFETTAASARMGMPTALTAGSQPAADELARTVPEAWVDQFTRRAMYVTGTIDVSAAAAGLPSGFVPGGEGVLLLHAVGRLVGLGDLPDPAEVMNPGVLSTPLTALGHGDRGGLTRLGKRSGCLQTPANGILTPAE